MPGRHAMRDFLHGLLSFPRRQSAPIGDQLLELRLIDDALAWAGGIVAIFSTNFARLSALGFARLTARRAIAIGAFIAVAFAGLAFAGLAFLAIALLFVLVLIFELFDELVKAIQDFA